MDGKALPGFASETIHIGQEVGRSFVVAGRLQEERIPLDAPQRKRPERPVV